MADVFDVEIYDPTAMAELVLTTDLMIVANTSEHHLSQHAIDIALGLAASHTPPDASHRRAAKSQDSAKPPAD